MKNSQKNIALFEDHTGSYHEWKARAFQGLPLVHLDAHLDFSFFYAKHPEQAFSEAKDLDDLKRELARSSLMRKFKRDIEKQENIGNYIYPAIRDGIVSAFYWVLPGQVTEETAKATRRAFERDPHKGEVAFDKAGGILHGRIHKCPFRASTIRDFSLSGPLLLDIDVDYLLYELGGERRPAGPRRVRREDIERVPWMYPKEFAELVKDKFPDPEFITIAYSVNGGYTPILYKFFGDEILCRLSGVTDRDAELDRLFEEKNSAIEAGDAQAVLASVERVASARVDEELKDRFRAHLYFWLFRLLGDERYYAKAISFDATYRARDNNYGWQYMRAGDPEKARAEFERILGADPGNAHACLGMARIYAEKGEHEEALGLLERVEDPGDEIHLNLADCFLHAGTLEKAEHALSRVKGQTAFGEFLKARVALKRARPYEETAEHLGNAGMLGMDAGKLWRLAEGVLKESDPLRAILKERYELYMERSAKKAGEEN